jgi:hypothetical protein
MLMSRVKRLGAFRNIQSFKEIIDLWGVWWQKRQFVQRSFLVKRITNRIGQFREDLHYVMDYEYWCRILQADGLWVGLTMS